MKKILFIILVCSLFMNILVYAADSKTDKKAEDSCWTYWKFEPQKDITAWELSQSVIMLNKRFWIHQEDITKMQNDYVNSFPRNVKRHWKKYKECE